MTYGSKTEEPHRRPRSGSGSAAAKTTVVSAKYLGFWTDDTALPPRGRSRPSRATSTGGSGPSLGSYGINGAFPYVEALEVEPPDDPGRPLALRRGVPRASTTSSSASSTRRGGATRQDGYFQNYVNFLYPYRWTQNVSVHAELVRRHGAPLLQLQGHDQPVPDRAHRRLHGRVLRRPVVAHQAPDDQPRPPLRPDDHQVRHGEGLRLPSLARRDQRPRPSSATAPSTGNIFDFKTWSPARRA